LWPAGQAALINGTALQIPAYDDIHPPTAAHTSAVVVPAALALAEELGSSGADLLTAVVTGIEVQLRIAHALGTPHYDAGWHNTATSGTFGAAVAAGLLLRLDANRMARALGLAATMASGLREGFSFGATTGLNNGRAAEAGILAAQLAAAGFPAPAATLDAHPGYLDVVSPEVERDWITRGLSETWLILENSPKPYATGMFTHACVDAGLQLHADGVDPATVESVTLRLHPQLAAICDKPAPKTGLSATMSVQHGFAVGWIDGAAGPLQYTDERVFSSDTTALRERTGVTADPSLSKVAVVADITLHGGTSRQVRVEHATGSAENPVPDSVIEQKFDWTAGAMLDPTGRAALLERAWTADQLTTIQDLTRRWAPEPQPATSN
jgi:2-methylcitrate dehydratase PrpD